MTRTPTRNPNLLPGIVLALLTLLLAGAAEAVSSSSFSMEILVNGVPLTEHAARGTTYVEALEGAEYSIRLYNNTGRRVAVALSVDGLNSIDAKTTTARAASKWVLGPYETITVSGWQTDVSHARRFYFTSEADSYGAWLGATANLGAVEAAVFRERRPPWYTRMWGADRPTQNEGSRGAPAPSGAAPEAEARAKSRSSEQSLSDDYAATGIGRQVGHRVRRVELELESRPAARLRIRYEYRPQLVRLGVLPAPVDHLDRREHAQGFTDMDFCPDPHGR